MLYATWSILQNGSFSLLKLYKFIYSNILASSHYIPHLPTCRFQKEPVHFTVCSFGNLQLGDQPIPLQVSHLRRVSRSISLRNDTLQDPMRLSVNIRVKLPTTSHLSTPTPFGCCALLLLSTHFTLHQQNCLYILETNSGRIWVSSRTSRVGAGPAGIHLSIQYSKCNLQKLQICIIF